MNIHLQQILNTIKEDKNLSEEEKNVILKSLKNADKEFEITNFKLDRTEKAKRTTAILLEETIEELEQKRKAVEEKNYKLEIENALEKVRAIALGMKEPADMPEVCKIIATELDKLSVKEIRNVQTAIFYESKGTYMNYEYYAKHDKKIITETSYTNSEMHRAFADQMLKGKGEFFSTLISKADLPGWIAYQKTTNVFIDTYLETAPSLSYYWFSLGPVALGISTYAVLSEEAINLFRRFLKVFELAYTRYFDIEQTIAQLREAKIEAALEKVRSRSLAVHKSYEFKEVIKVVFERLQGLEIPMTSVSINVIIKGSKDTEAYICGSGENGLTLSHIRLIHFDNPIANDRYDAYTKGLDFFSKTYNTEEKNSFYEYEFLASDLKHIPADIKKMVMESQLYTCSVAFAKNSMIVVNDFEGKSLSAKEIDIVKRFAKVFEQAYVRFLDLQKAEAQARESQIQLALERVRARTMAMQQSTELADTASVLFQQIKGLGFETWSCGFCTWQQNEIAEVWMGADSGEVLPPMMIPYIKEPTHHDIYKASLTGTDVHEKVWEGKALKKHYEYLSSIPSVAAAIRQLEDAGLSLPARQCYYVGFFKQGYLLLITKEPNAEMHDLSKRFSKVFEQTYTRFLDLQKAEAQAREAKIEVALERVRSRSMAMHKSAEVMDLAVTVYDELQKLDFKFGAATIIIMDEKTGNMEHWLAGFIQKNHVESYQVNNSEHPLHVAQLAAWREGAKFASIEMSGPALKSYAKEMFMQSGYKNLPDEEKAMLLANEHAVFNMAYISHGALMWAPSALSDDNATILQRFAKVFEQTYTRFLDLQKAEAQAREAQIELGLERVRARAMAMQNSDELSDLVAILFDELIKLDLILARCIIWIFDPNTLDARIWMANSEDKKTANSYYIKRLNHPYYDALIKGWRERNQKWVFDLSGEYKKSIDELLINETELSRLPEVVKAGIRSSGHTIISGSFNNFGFIEASGPVSHSEGQFEILTRFGKVFDLSYTRFNDLKQAEVQAREAQIQLALERARTQSMIMQHSKELDDTLQVFHEQVQLLGISSTFSFLWLPDEEKEQHIFWAIWKENLPAGQAGENGSVIFKNKAINYPLDRNDAATAQCLIDWKGDEPVVCYHVPPNGVENYFAAWKELIDGVETLKPERFRDGLYYAEAFMKYGCFGVMVAADLRENEKKILGRFAIEFERTYTRFLDLQKTEVQAREAQIEVALERVRSRTLAMQKSDELAETSAVLFRQLIRLGIEPNRLYISIMKDDNGETEFWITDEDGSKVSSAYTDNLNDNPSFKKMYDGWRAGMQSMIIDMKGKELKEYFKHLTSLGVPFKDGLTQKRRIQHLAYFNRGFIGMAAPDDQPEETLHLLERFAAVFNLTFTRFSDLKIAEAHAIKAEEDLIKLQTEKKRAEDALTELQAAQKQLIQSEKMASLGELTAGIAHEIQNPLNFVNNFSEVSSELIDEINEEIIKGNSQEIKIILNDIKQNLEKINHHGKRADAIVKGMLQHSRSSTSQKEPTDINVLCDEYIRLCYHGLRAKDKSLNVTINTDFDKTIEKINIIPQDISRVMLNLLTNAFYAVKLPNLLKGEYYEPTVSVSTKKINGNVEIRVKDNGHGIPQNIIDKIFQPFFTTKPTGQGTGLGLSLSYDIIKAHGGEIKVETKEGIGSVFIIQLPIV